MTYLVRVIILAVVISIQNRKIVHFLKVQMSGKATHLESLIHVHVCVCTERCA